MVARTQYTHHLYIEKRLDSMLDEKGEWSECFYQWEELCMCRFEKSSPTPTIKKSPDGEIETFAGVVYIPRNIMFDDKPIIPTGLNIVVSKKDIDMAQINDVDYLREQYAMDNVLTWGDIKGYDKGKYHGRIYV